jgi:hypothetical protein
MRIIPTRRGRSWRIVVFWHGEERTIYSADLYSCLAKYKVLTGHSYAAGDETTD